MLEEEFTSDFTTDSYGNTTLSPVEQDHFCKLILYLEVPNTRYCAIK